MLTETKRAEIRARNDEIDRREKEAKKKMVRMEDQDEMLAAAESIPVPVGKMPLQEFQQHGAGGEGGGGRGLSAARGAGAEGGGSEGGQDGRQRRDPLTAWVCNCYNNDDYAGHVSDLRKFLRGIDFHNVSFANDISLRTRDVFFLCWNSVWGAREVAALHDVCREGRGVFTTGRKRALHCLVFPRKRRTRVRRLDRLRQAPDET